MKSNNKQTTPKANDSTRTYIDRFVSQNYNQLARSFSNQSGIINSEALGSMDKLNETILALYTDPTLSFASWEDAERQLKGRFAAKSMRVEAKSQGAKEDAGNKPNFSENECFVPDYIDNFGE